MSTELVELAKAGDEAAFRELVEPYRSGLHAHCYRIRGSVQDAEDALQETLLAAWLGIAGFEERASLRTWLYSIATNRALNMLRAAKRRPTVELFMPEPELPEPTLLRELSPAALTSAYTHSSNRSCVSWGQSVVAKTIPFLDLGGNLLWHE